MILMFITRSVKQASIFSSGYNFFDEYMKITKENHLNLDCNAHSFLRNDFCIVLRIGFSFLKNISNQVEQ